MVLTAEPPAVAGVDARRVADASELEVASAVSAAAFGENEDGEDWEERFAAERGGHAPREYLAFIDGAYRALVRARWDDAVAPGQPALVVHAGAMSRPILERLGFQAVAELEVLLDPATC